MWYCNICDKTIIIKSEPKHPNSNSQKHKEKHSVVVKDYDFFTQDNNKTYYIFNNCARDFFLHRFKFRCIYNIEMTNGDFANGINSDKKLKKRSRKWFYTYINKNNLFQSIRCS